MRIFYDVDTQNDFMNKDGALYVPDAESIKPNLALLTKYARANGIQVVGSVDKHFGTEEYRQKEGELARWGGPFPDHCMTGTFGQKKIAETDNAGSIIFEKQHYDIFTNHSLEAYLKEKEVTEAVVYGVATDFCVKAAVLGMQQRGVQCYVVKDAIKGVFPGPTNSALEEMLKAGAKFTTTKDVLEGRV